MLIFSVVIFVFSTLTLSPCPPLPRKAGGHDPQLLWERRPWVPPPYGCGGNDDRTGERENQYA